jgi:2-polyprenyl-6-methoxyphenol hydroxylase-like FAD-dependent oxidoreductase
MHRTSVVVIGAGQAGLAVSHLLSAAGADHVVLERGRTAARWDSHPWQSLRQARGVGLAGRLTDVDGRRVRLAGDLAATTGEADERLRRLLRRIDAFADRTAIAPRSAMSSPSGRRR